MGLFSKEATGGFTDEIRCDETEYLIWKWSRERHSLGLVPPRARWVRCGVRL